MTNFLKRNLAITAKRQALLILIILFAIILRFWRLDSYPAFNADEAAIGYNAYSLIQTGRDEHGNPWPVHFQSFNDYKPGLYFYLVLPFVKVLGLNEWAVRIPGAILGVLTVLTVYYLVKELFGDGLRVTSLNAQRATRNWLTDQLPLIASFMLAISPWHIHFSRGGWEVNAATFLMTTGLLFFLRAVKNPSFKTFAFSLLPFTLSLYTYHAARIVVPLLGLGLLVIYRGELFKNIKPVLKAGVIGLVLLVPLVLDLTRGSVFSRAAGVGLFADPGPLNRINEQRGEHTDFTGLGAKLLHNKGVNYGLAFAKNWADHFHGEFLFLSGDAIQRNKVPETGQMYLFDILLLAIGLIVMFKNYSLSSKPYSLVFWWLIVAPTAAALTFQSPHALRAYNMVVPLVIISSFGLVKLVEIGKTYIKSRKTLLLFYLLLFTLITWSFARYEHMYWRHLSKEYPFSSQYGVKELVNYVHQNQDKYQKVVVTDRYDQPYILFLFYLKYPPGEFQVNHQLTPRDQFGFSTVRDFDKFSFVSVSNWNDLRVQYPNSLIAGTDEEIPEEANIIKEIYGTNGYKYFQIVAN